MDPSTAHHQEIMCNNPSSSSLENMLVCSSTKSSQQQQQDKKPRPQPDQALKCPRCDSTNTKFCYYNNYSLSQPRYFCKSCRRYWTKGGTLRNVPVGGGCRKNKRSSSSAAAKKSSSQDQQSGLAVPNINGIPHLGYDTNDLSLAFARLQKQSSFDHHHHHQDDFSMLAGTDPHHHHHHHVSNVLGNPSIMTSSASGATTTAFLDALRSNFMGTQNGNLVHHGFHSYGFGQDGILGSTDHHQIDPQQQQQEHEQIGMSFEDASTVSVTPIMKQEISCTESTRGGHDSSRVLWGFPWQLSNGGSSDHHLGPTMSHELDTARESWNNSTNFTSAWHGLLNSPLM